MALRKWETKRGPGDSFTGAVATDLHDFDFCCHAERNLKTNDGMSRTEVDERDRPREEEESQGDRNELDRYGCGDKIYKSWRILPYKCGRTKTIANPYVKVFAFHLYFPNEGREVDTTKFGRDTQHTSPSSTLNFVILLTISTYKIIDNLRGQKNAALFDSMHPGRS